MPVYLTRIYIAVEAPTPDEALKTISRSVNSLNHPLVSWSHWRRGKGLTASPYPPLQLQPGATNNLESQHDAYMNGPANAQADTPAPGPGSTQPTASKSFHMPSVKKRDDMGGLMGSGS